ncbi:MAG TPA: riboflavin biosynthesis protein RibD, partial [Firmicutes bacterium]|nr:riboflavin biosynthesis protein RibD [Bacillota bacterium]
SLNASLLGEGLVDKVLVFIAPKIIGGKDAITWVEGTGARTIGGCATLSISRVRRFRGDILLEAYVNTDGRGY